MFNISNEWMNWTNAKSQVKIYRHLNSLCKKVNLFLSIDGNGKDYPLGCKFNKDKKRNWKGSDFYDKIGGKTYIHELAISKKNKPFL